MTTLVVEYASESGEITNWHYHVDDDYDPGENELTPDIDHRELARMKVVGGELVENPEYDSRPLRERVTTSEHEIEEAKTEAKAIKSALGYDDIDTQDRDRTLVDRVDAIERGVGAGQKGPEKGIAHRLDELEETQAEIRETQEAIIERLDEIESDE